MKKIILYKLKNNILSLYINIYIYNFCDINYRYLHEIILLLNLCEQDVLYYK